MCGIGGIRRFGNEPIEAWQIESLLLSNERRGNDASGVVLQNRGDKKLRIWKSSDPASTAIHGDDFEKFLKEHLSEKTLIALVHTRAATASSSKKWENNHPLYLGNTAVVHNGSVTNHDHLFKRFDMKRSCETDSDALRGILDKFGLTERGMKELNAASGGVAMAAVSEEHPGWLMLVKSGSPLVVATTPEQLIFSSEKEGIYSAVRPWVQRYGVWARPLRTDVAFASMPPNTGWLFNEKERCLHREVKTAYSYREPDRSTYTKDYEKRQARNREGEVKSGGDMGLPDFISCPHCKYQMKIEPHQKYMHLNNLWCPECKYNLDGTPGAEAEWMN